MLLIELEVHFSLLFSNKADFRVCFVARKIRSPLFFMSIPTISSDFRPTEFASVL